MIRARAMTLIEVLAALAILVVLSSGVIGFFLGITERRDQLERLAMQQQDVATLLDRLEMAAMSAVALAPDGTAGVRGDATSISIVTRGVSTPLSGSASVADAAVMGFAFDEARAVCDCSLAPLGEGEPIREPILSHVERLRFRYLLGRDWRDTFDSARAGSLPAAIEISVWLEPRSGKASSAPGTTGEPPDPDGDPLAEDFGPLDFPEPAAGSGWIPREPDCLRVLVVPDAPASGWGGPGA